MSFIVQELVNALPLGKLTLSEYMVADKLAWHADESGYCYPGIALLAQESRICTRTVTRSLERLCAPWGDGHPSPILKRVSRNAAGRVGSGSGRGNVSGYQFDLKLLRELREFSESLGALKVRRIKDDIQGASTIEGPEEKMTKATLEGKEKDDICSDEKVTTENSEVTLTTEKDDIEDSYIGRTVIEQSSNNQRASLLLARISGKASALRLRQKLEPTQVKIVCGREELDVALALDLEEQIREIVCAYPRSLLTKLVADEVRQPAIAAVIGALETEQGRQGGTMRSLANWLLGRMKELSNRVPEEEWKYLPRTDTFFNEFQYRQQPEDFTS